MIKYHQKTYNSCCLSILEAAFQCIGDNGDVHALVNSIKESFNLKKENCNNIIHFSNDIMKNRRKIKGEQNLRYNMKVWKKKYAFDIINDIIENFTLVQFLESIEI